MASAPTATRSKKGSYAAAVVDAPARLTAQMSFNQSTGDYVPLADIEGRDLELWYIQYNPDGKFGPCVVLSLIDRTDGADAVDAEGFKVITSSITLVPFFQQVLEEFGADQFAFPVTVKFIKRLNPKSGHEFWAVE